MTPCSATTGYLLHDLPVLGAQVLLQWARQKYGIRLMIVVIPHTFGRHLNFNCHLRILVSEGGLREDGTPCRARARLDKKALMPMWRYPDRYRHTVRYFGLLAPRVKCQTHDTVFALVGQERRGKPRRLRWSTSLQKCFGVDPLVDRNGQRMRWVRRIPPGEQN